MFFTGVLKSGRCCWSTFFMCH